MSSGGATSIPPTSFFQTGLLLAEAFTTLSANEKRFVSQIQGRTYANIFGLVERLHQCQGPGAERGHWFRRSGRARGIGTVQRRRSCNTRRCFRLVRRDGRLTFLPSGYRFDWSITTPVALCCSWQKYLGGVWDLTAGYRTVHSSSTIVRASTPTPSSPSCSGRVPFFTGRGKPARDPRRTRMGCATTPG